MMHTDDKEITLAVLAGVAAAIALARLLVWLWS